jgi:3-methyladenine DNA glycosylase AlkC
MKAQTTFSLKDHLFNADRVDYLATLFERVDADFPGQNFRTGVLAAFPALELKARISHITATLHASLPPGYRAALAIILDALPPELDTTKTDDDYGDFIFAPLSLFVATYGCTAEHLEVSLNAQRSITKRFSAEDALRYFLNAFPARTLQFLCDCAHDDNYHVRRLASESTRPLLPWAQRLSIHYREPLPILELLFADRTRYVTRSVANHLNDIGKLDPELVVTTLRRWQESNQQLPAEMLFITKHALRSLVKRGHGAALDLMGFGGEPDITLSALATDTPGVRVGEAFRFSLSVLANSPQKLLIDYVMTFAGEGRANSRKVFKLKQVELGAGESLTLTKVHPMRLMTTRRLHSGEHRVTLQVNGHPLGELTFDLVVESP